jgi:integrase
VGVKEVLLLAVETSMRMGELFSLRWEYIKINPGKGKKSTTGTAHLLDTKNGESRTVALSSAAVEALQCSASPNRRQGVFVETQP